MKKLIPAVLGLFCSVSASMAQFGPQVSSPVVNSDNTVTFNYRNDKAEDVKVDVQFAGRHDMVKGSDGVWSLTLGPAAPDMYPYCFIVDGVSIMDPQNPDWFPNEGFKNSIVDIRGDKPLLHSLQNVPHGSVDYVTYWSEGLGCFNRAIVYTPPFYDRHPEKKYPVFYLISGTTDTEEVYHKVGRVNFIMDNLLAAGKAQEMIIVLPYGNPVNFFKGRKRPAAEQDSPFQDCFTPDFKEALMPFIEQNYRTINDRDHRAIGGFSRGGNQGLSIGLTNLDRFSWLCSYSSFTSTALPGVYDDKDINSKIHLFWLGVGTDDFLYGNARDYMDFLDEKGIKNVKEFTSDKFGHTWMNAKYFLNRTLPLLFQSDDRLPKAGNVPAPALQEKEGQRLTPEVMARTFPRGVVSPEYVEDGSVTFRCQAPEAAEVLLDCQMFGEKKPLVKDAEGNWTITVKPEVPDIYPYCFLIDGKQVADPQNMYLFPNEGFKNSLVDVRGGDATMQDVQQVPHGKISYRYYHSNTFGIDRPMCVYTPAGYDPADKVKYPVLYLIHGMTDTYETWFKVGRVPEIMDNLIAQGLSKKMIVVMPYANPYPELMRQGKASVYDVMDVKKVAAEIVNDVVPFIEENYQVSDNADSRAVAGFSLGGRQALATGFGHPDRFHYVAAYAPAIFGDEHRANFDNGIYQAPEVLQKNLKLMILSTGTDDFLFQASKDLDATLTGKGIRHTFLTPGGGHTWMNCRDNLELTVRQLF